MARIKKSARIEMNHRIMEKERPRGLQNLFIWSDDIFFPFHRLRKQSPKKKGRKKIARETRNTRDVKFSNRLCMRIGANRELYYSAPTSQRSCQITLTVRLRRRTDSGPGLLLIPLKSRVPGLVNGGKLLSLQKDFPPRSISQLTIPKM